MIFLFDVPAVILILCSCMTFLLTVVQDTSVIIMMFGGTPILSGVCYNVLSSILIELFPTYIRAMAVSVNMICGRIGAIIGSQVFSLLIDSQCLLLFQLISGTVLCCAVVPFFFNLPSRSSSKDDSPREEQIKNKS
ncbi:hypothetical protein J6590_082670 [Homalodisca vitripennis]|nr:hypothetical protein J6590_082670 [Homalodisca vitripennis]